MVEYRMETSFPTRSVRSQAPETRYLAARRHEICAEQRNAPSKALRAPTKLRRG